MGLLGAYAAWSRRSTAAGRSSGVLTATVGTPLRPRLARPMSAPAGASSMRPVTPAACERLHAEVPAHRATRPGRRAGRGTRRRRSTSEPSRFVQSRQRRVGGGERARRTLARAVDGGRHVAGVERAGDLQRDDAGAGRRALRRARRARRGRRRRRSGRRRCSWRGRGRARRGGASSAVSSPPRTALMPVGASRRPRPSRAPRSRTKRNGVGLAEHAGAGRGRDLADRVAGDAADALAAAVGEQRRQREEAGRRR